MYWCIFIMTSSSYLHVFWCKCNAGGWRCSGSVCHGNCICRKSPYSNQIIFGYVGWCSHWLYNFLPHRRVPRGRSDAFCRLVSLLSGMVIFYFVSECLLPCNRFNYGTLNIVCSPVHLLLCACVWAVCVRMRMVGVIPVCNFRVWGAPRLQLSD